MNKHEHHTCIDFDLLTYPIIMGDNQRINQDRLAERSTHPTTLMVALIFSTLVAQIQVYIRVLY